MSTSVLQAIRERLQAQLVAAQTQVSTIQAEIAQLQQELAGIDALLIEQPAALAAPQVPKNTAENVSAMNLVATPRVGAPALAAEKPVQDSLFGQFKKRFEATDFEAEIPLMSDETLMLNAALKRTELTGTPTVAALSGMRTICITYLRGLAPSYLRFLADIRRNAPHLKASLMTLLHGITDTAILKAYPWLATSGAVPLSDAELDSISQECRAFAQSLTVEREQRESAVREAAGAAPESLLGTRLREALLDSLQQS